MPSCQHCGEPWDSYHILHELQGFLTDLMGDDVDAAASMSDLGGVS
jgi:hypothetical protein